MIGGFLVSALKMEDKSKRERFVFGIVLLNTAIALTCVFHRPIGEVELFSLGSNLSIAFFCDGLSALFASIVALLWPISTLYAFEYMSHEGDETRFFAFYTVTYGVTLGIAFSANFVTMYLFYELLTFITIPLVTHGQTGEAARKLRGRYIAYSVGGASCFFIGLVYVLFSAGHTQFVFGGILNEAAHSEATPVIFLFTFLGFCVKAAMFPLHGWLVAAAVAPTPVTALLHAVAVVNAGAFAAMRCVYYVFGANLLRDTWPQYILLGLACFTILFGSAMALRERHLKRRLAYSTISKLSYMLYAVLLMNEAGLAAGITQMAVHSIVKITLFFCAGAIYFQTRYAYANQVIGLGRKMPIVFVSFTTASLGLMGVPLFPGFLSKFKLMTAGIGSGILEGSIGIASLGISTVLTAIYLSVIFVPAFFPGQHQHEKDIETLTDPGLPMKVSLIVLTALILTFGLVFSSRAVSWFDLIAAGRH
jgi:multicomponent Na+:H+ antiporter subunit D